MYLKLSIAQANMNITMIMTIMKTTTNERKCIPIYGNSPDIMLTCPCNVDTLTHHFHIVKLGFTRVYIIILFFVLKQLIGTASILL